MNWLNARCSLASGPFMITKRLPDMAAAVSKSSPPCASPSTTWSLGSKSKVLGVPQVLKVTLSSSSLPVGVSGCGTFGNVAIKSLSFSMVCSARSSSVWRATLISLTEAISSSVDLPCAFKTPICLERLLRFSCRFCAARRCFLRASRCCIKVDLSSVNPRCARRFSMVSTDSISTCKSNISVLTVGFEPGGVATPFRVGLDKAINAIICYGMLCICLSF